MSCLRAEGRERRRSSPEMRVSTTFAMSLLICLEFIETRVTWSGLRVGMISSVLDSMIRIVEQPHVRSESIDRI